MSQRKKVETEQKGETSCDGLGLCFAVFVILMAIEILVAIGNFTPYPEIEFAARIAGTILAAITVVRNIYEQVFVSQDQRTKTFGRYAGELLLLGVSHMWFFFPGLVAVSHWANIFIVANFFYGQPHKK
ncbi:MAG: hypothetical protein M0P64_00110 [Candidatus Pacebacteria bacterium]|jgi:hypothetical protein|nr:hypothetical protein [Candidatus Paceibacterota bacterium]